MKSRTSIPKTAGVVLGLVGAALLSLVGGCNQENDKDPVGQKAQAMGEGEAQCWVLAQGPNNNDLGSVCVDNDATTLNVTFNSDEPCLLTQAHVCADTADFPWTPPGQCAYKAEFNDNPLTSYTVPIPLSDFPEAVCGETTFFIQAHAQLSCAGVEESAYGGSFKGKVEYLLQCVDGDEGCTLTQGYWKNHPEDWTGVVLSLGGVDYSQSSALSLLKTPPKGDASLILAHQWIAAKLNIGVGGASDSAIAGPLNDAEMWFLAHVDADGLLPFAVAAGSAEGAEAVAIAAVLDEYNNGVIGPGHCED